MHSSHEGSIAELGSLSYATKECSILRRISSKKLVKVDRLTENLLNVGRSLLSGSGLRRFESNGKLRKCYQPLHSTSRQQFVAGQMISTKTRVDVQL